MKRIQCLLIGGLSFVWSCGGTQSPDSLSAVEQRTEAETTSKRELKRLDGPIAVIQTEAQLPALAIALVDRNGIGALGIAGQTHAAGRQVTAQDRFHLGSNTKAMTATLVARLVERGLLAWTTPLSALFPDSTIHPQLAQVTIEQLLRHEGGITAWTDPTKMKDDWAIVMATSRKDVVSGRAQLAKRLLARAPEHPIGSFAYSNAGYILVGAALERLTGKTWEELMREEVFRPLAMARCGFGPMATESAPDAVRSHLFDGQRFTPAPVGPRGDNPPTFGPAGTVHCDLNGWAQFLRLHLGAGPETYLKPATISQLHTANPKSRYAFGWLSPKPTLLMHEGSNSMNHALVLVNVELGQALVVVTNAGPPPKVQTAVQQAVKVLITASAKEAAQPTKASKKP